MFCARSDSAEGRIIEAAELAHLGSQLQPVRDVVVHRAFPLAVRVPAGNTALRLGLAISLLVRFVDFPKLVPAHLQRKLVRLGPRQVPIQRAQRTRWSGINFAEDAAEADQKPPLSIGDTVLEVDGMQKYYEVHDRSIAAIIAARASGLSGAVAL